MREFINNVKIVVYLLRRYNIKLSPVCVSKSSTGSFSCEYQSITKESGRSFMYSVVKSKINIDWLNPRYLDVFLHEVGHIAQFHRASKQGFPESHIKGRLFAEKRASVWALRVAKLLGKRTQDTNKYLDWAYGTYLAELIKDDPVKLADESYKAVKAFGVKYE